MVEKHFIFSIIQDLLGQLNYGKYSELLTLKFTTKIKNFADLNRS